MAQDLEVDVLDAVPANTGDGNPISLPDIPTAYWSEIAEHKTLKAWVTSMCRFLCNRDSRYGGGGCRSNWIASGRLWISVYTVL